MVYHFTGRCAVLLCTALAQATSAAAPARADPNPLVALVDAATSRLQTAEPVAATKWINGGSIEDPPRVAQVLAGVASDATNRGIDSGYVRRVFTDQIDATTGIEYIRLANGSSIRQRRPALRPT